MSSRIYLSIFAKKALNAHEIYNTLSKKLNHLENKIDSEKLFIETNSYVLKLSSITIENSEFRKKRIGFANLIQKVVFCDPWNKRTLNNHLYDCKLLLGLVFDCKSDILQDIMIITIEIAKIIDGIILSSMD
jgi:hypothetical protein